MIRDVIFIHPDITLSPIVTSLVKNSPVNAFVSNCDTPCIISPSRGIFSPGFTTIISPILTLLGSTIFIESLVSKFAVSGLMSIRLDIDDRDLLIALSCMNSPTLEKIITATAS